MARSAFLCQFVPPGSADPSWPLAGLSLVFMIMTFVIFAVYGLFAGLVRDRIIASPRVMIWLRRTFAATYVILAGRLALLQR